MKSILTTLSLLGFATLGCSLSNQSASKALPNPSSEPVVDKEGETTASPGGTANGTKGGMTFFLADAPADDATSLAFTVTGIELHAKANSTDPAAVSLAPTAGDEINLLALSDGKRLALLEGAEVPPGAYAEIRLQIDQGKGAVLTLADGSTHRIETSHLATTGFRIAGTFMVDAKSTQSFTIHIDARKSLTRSPNGTYILNPVAQVLPERIAAALRGVSASGESFAWVCAYLKPASGPLPPRDSDPECAQAERAARVKEGAFVIAHLAPLTYDLRFFRADGTYVDKVDVVAEAGKEVKVEF